MRGGAGPLDPNVVAKAHSVLQLVNAVTIFAAPTKSLELYGLEASGCNVHMMENVGANLLCYAIQCMATVFYHQPLEKAAAMGTIPVVYLALKSLADGTAKKVGMSNSAHFILTSLWGSALIYGGINGEGWTKQLLRVVAWCNIANGLVGGFAPKTLSSLWGHNASQMPDSAALLLKSSMLFGLSHAVFQNTLLDQKSVYKAVGWGMVPHLMQSASVLFLTKEVDKLNAPKAPGIFWLVVHLAVIATLAF